MSAPSCTKPAEWNSGVSKCDVQGKAPADDSAQNQSRTGPDAKALLFQNGVVVLEYVVKCCYSWWFIHCKNILWK